MSAKTKQKKLKLPLTLTLTGTGVCKIAARCRITVWNSKRPQCSKARRCGRSRELLTCNAKPTASYQCRHLNRDMPGEGDGLIFPSPDRGVICAISRQNQFFGHDSGNLHFSPAMLLIITQFRDQQVTYSGRLSTDLGRQLIRKGEAASVVFR